MNISELCIRRPVMTIALSLALLVIGVLGYLKLPIAALPNYNQPVIYVNASLPGASPDVMASSVATPLEQQFASITGLVAMSSSSTLGASSVILEFGPGRDIDAAAADVQAALMRAQSRLPVEMLNLPTWGKINPSDSPVIFFALTSASVPLSELNDYAENLVSPTLSMIDGVGQVNIFGKRRFAVRIRAKIDELASRDMTMEDLASAVSAANSNSPAGVLDGPRQSMVVETNLQLRNAAAFAGIIIKSRNGVAVRLKDVAEVEDSVEAARNGTWLDGQQAIVIGVQRQPNANIVAVVDGIQAAFPRIRAQVPASIDVRTLSDYSVPIRSAIADVQFSLMLAIVLVILVIFASLKRLSATLIPLLSLPLSLIGCFALMHWFGYSLNNISLLAITISVGLVVDDAIVMLENIMRHIEQDMEPVAAAILGAREVGFTIVSISLSLVAVFLPIFFMPGNLGQMFHEFAVVVSVTVVLSAVVSLTIVPMLCSQYLRHAAPEQENWAGRLFERGFMALQDGYAASLDWCLVHKKSVMLLALGSFVATVLLYNSVPKGFFPQEDTGLVRAVIEGPQDVSYAAMADLAKRVGRVIQDDKQVAAVLVRVVGGNSGALFITLKPREERDAVSAMLARWRPRLKEIPGVQVYFTPVQNVSLGGKSGKSRFQYLLQSVRGDELGGWSDKLMAKMKAEPVFQDVSGDLEVGGLQAILDIDRDRANLAGVQIRDIRAALYNAYGERQVSTIYTGTGSYKVLMEDIKAGKQGESDMLGIHVRSSSGVLVPLSSVARVRRVPGVLAINHTGQLQTVTITFNLAPGATFDEASQKLDQLKASLNMPVSIVGAYSGDAEQARTSQTSQVLLLLSALAVIYVLLCVLYESFIHPVTILIGLPSAAAGALLSLHLFKFELSLIATIGILMLIGIVKKNAIMMVDFALAARREQGMSAHEAIRTACLLRFRPIMMTTVTALMGVLPIAFGLGAGAELRQPLGVAVAGGLIVSQVMTLLITPVIYLVLDRFGRQVAPAADAAKTDLTGPKAMAMNATNAVAGGTASASKQESTI